MRRGGGGGEEKDEEEETEEKEKEEKKEKEKEKKKKKVIMILNTKGQHHLYAEAILLPYKGIPTLMWWGLCGQMTLTGMLAVA